MEKFVQIESFSGILLFSATIVALVWANSAFGASYQNLWNYKLGFEVGDFEISKSLLFWINDGLMAIFFFLIGLEIKREVLMGELNTMKKAALPVFAAVGGIIVPVGVFFILNNDPETFKGWGIPMATDIAFSLAILTLLGKKAPLALKIFLTAFAIVDDLGAILAIAFFYSSSIDWGLVGMALIPFMVLIGLSIKGFYNKYLYIFIALIVWLLFLKSGLHPTIAGVMIAFTIPIQQKEGVVSSMGFLNTIVEKLSSAPYKKKPILTKEQIYLIDDLQDWTNKVQSPLQHIEHSLHGWVAYFIIPIFALANAGLVFSGENDLNFTLSINIAIALILGKCIGITLFSIASVKAGFAVLPEGITYRKILGTAFLAGVGFTMSIFISNLAFTDSTILIDSSKIGILIGSFVAGLIGYLVLKFSK